MPKVSVIVPVYNVEEYLAECLESVINQTEKDIEIICVEDCSTDSSLQILQEYAEKDNRIIVLQNEQNFGLSVTRNNGLAVAKGEFVLFVDSDDLIKPNLLEITLKYTDGVDLVCFDYNEFSNSLKIKDSYYKIVDGLYQREEYFIEAIDKKSIIYSACCRIYRKDFLFANNIIFKEGIVYEDILFCFECLTKAETIYSINKDLYCYRIREHSITNSKLCVKNLNDHFYSLCEVIKQYILNDFTIEFSLAIEQFIKRLIDIYREMYVSYCAESIGCGSVNLDRLEPVAKLQRIFSGYLIGLANDINISNDKVDKIKSSENVLVYGAGDVARKIINYLDLKEIPIIGIAVSDITKNKKSLMGNPVKALTEYNNIKEDCLVVIAVTPKYSVEIKEILSKNGFNNYIEVF